MSSLCFLRWHGKDHNYLPSKQTFCISFYCITLLRSIWFPIKSNCVTFRQTRWSPKGMNAPITAILNQGYVTLAIKISSEFCDIYAHAQSIFLLCCKFQIIILKTVEVPKIWTLLCQYKAIFLGKLRVCNSSNKSSATFMHIPSLYSYYAASFKSLSWKLWEKLAKAQTLLCHVHKTIF